MKFTSDQNITLQNALDTWGERDQKAMAIGEVGEYLSLVGRQAQNRASNEDWISEIADVIIMMEQMAKLYGYNKVQEMVDYKMHRLAGKLASYDNLNKIEDLKNRTTTIDIMEYEQYHKNKQHFKFLMENENGKSTQKD